ncbi:hypothetical protein [Nocardioides marinquilinus]
MSKRNLVIGAVTSVVIVAVALVLALVVIPRLGGGEVELPEEVGGLTALDELVPPGADDDPEAQDRAAENRARQEDSREYSAEKISEIFDGADADQRSYADPDTIDPIYTVIAVAADAGPLLVSNGFPDPEYLGLALPREEWFEQGDAECVGTRLETVPAGEEPTEEQRAFGFLVCQRSSGSLSVRVSVNDGDVDAAVDLLDAVYTDLD